MTTAAEINLKNSVQGKKKFCICMKHKEESDQHLLKSEN
jgi:hypothetical protein